MTAEQESRWELRTFIVRFTQGFIAGLVAGLGLMYGIEYFIWEIPERLSEWWLVALLGWSTLFGLLTWWYGERFWDFWFGEDGIFDRIWY